MSKSAMTVMAVLIVLIFGVVGLKRMTGPSSAGRQLAPAAPQRAMGIATTGANPAPLSAAERERIQAFWAVYQRAGREKQARQWALAARDYRKALELKPGHWDALYYLGNVSMEMRRYDEAARAYRQLVASDSQAARAYTALGALYSNPNAGPLFDLAQAEREYALARRANADESGSVLRLGEVALAAGKTAQAQEYLEAAGRTNFRSVSARFLLGYLAWQAGDRGHARTLFRQGIALTSAQKPPAGVLGEGDTHLQGYRAMVLPGQHGLFDVFVAELWRNKDTSDARMNRLYTRMSRFLGELPRR
ncbi:MAG TPA: tetratricopeptide repeat protein [Chthonomonadaceae bacterium]|nr:tetratricopeptide repeat protein [Chthonomonadaceae bacterium]